jgi:hypothetical protein
VGGIVFFAAGPRQTANECAASGRRAIMDEDDPDPWRHGTPAARALILYGRHARGHMTPPASGTSGAGSTCRRPRSCLDVCSGPALVSACLVVSLSDLRAAGRSGVSDSAFLCSP